MAVVNVDLSEYDAIRKRNSELEEQVKELKKLNESLKSGSKVILRKETVVIERIFRERSLYGDMFFHQPTEDDKYNENRRALESSESYVNFEDVRLKVEQAMQDEVNRSIHDRNLENKPMPTRRMSLTTSTTDGRLNSRRCTKRRQWTWKRNIVARSVILNQKNFAFLICSLKSTNWQQSCMMI